MVNSVLMQKKAVECGYYPIFHYNPCNNKFIMDSKNVNFNAYDEFLNNQSRYAMLKKINAFKNQWAFPIPAYEMLVTGEETGQLAEMMEKVAEYYQDLHGNAVTRIKTFIEPVMIVFLTVIVGVIVLSIVIPMFSMYSNLG